MFLNPKKPLDEKSQKIHESALSAAWLYKKAETTLIQALIEVERGFIFARLGYSSLFAYSVNALGLSEAITYSAINVARKAREVPQLKIEIEQGNISLSKANKIVSVLTPLNQNEWLEKAKSLSSRVLEKAVAEINPKRLTPEKTKYVNSKRIELSLGVSEELMLKLRRSQDLVSQSKKTHASLEDTLEVLSSHYLKQKDPLEKAKRVIVKKGLQQQQHQNNNQNELLKQESPTNLIKTLFPCKVHQRTPIPAHIEHAVRFRDQDRCQQKRQDGSACGEKRWLDLHHIMPISQGGAHTIENILTLCKTHHQLIHEHK